VDGGHLIAVLGEKGAHSPCLAAGQHTHVPRSADPGDLVRLEALRAHVRAARDAVDEDAQTLNIGVVAAARAPMGVRDVVPESGRLTADITNGSHNSARVTKVFRDASTCGAFRTDTVLKSPQFLEAPPAPG
jgi:hypothetical protein